MSLSTPTALDRAPWEAPLAPVASRFARLRARARCEALARFLPRSVLFAGAPRTGRGKRVALTFDDRPDAMTPLCLDALETLGVRDTFFLFGANRVVSDDMTATYV